MGWLVPVIVNYFRVVFAGAAYLDRRRGQQSNVRYAPPRLEVTPNEVKIKKKLPLTTQIGIGLLYYVVAGMVCLVLAFTRNGGEIAAFLVVVLVVVAIGVRLYRWDRNRQQA